MRKVKIYLEYKNKCFKFGSKSEEERIPHNVVLYPNSSSSGHLRPIFSPKIECKMYDKSQTVIKKIPYTPHKMRVFKTTPDDLTVGQAVIYFEVMGENGPKSEPFETTIKSECWLASGSMVVNIEGKRGCVNIGHIQLIAPAPKLELSQLRGASKKIADMAKGGRNV